MQNTILVCIIQQPAINRVALWPCYYRLRAGPPTCSGLFCDGLFLEKTARNQVPFYFSLETVGREAVSGRIKAPPFHLGCSTLPLPLPLPLLKPICSVAPLLLDGGLSP